MGNMGNIEAQKQVKLLFLPLSCELAILAALETTQYTRKASVLSSVQRAVIAFNSLPPPTAGPSQNAFFASPSSHYQYRAHSAHLPALLAIEMEASMWL
jgi:hypothetical protein